MDVLFDAVLLEDPAEVTIGLLLAGPPEAGPVTFACVDELAKDAAEPDDAGLPVSDTPPCL